MKLTINWDSYQANKIQIARVILLLLFGWWLIGFFPVINFESDSINLITGCELMWKNGIEIPPSFSYAWDMQPLVYFVIVFIKHIVPFFTCEQIYCTLTFLCTIGYLFLISSFVSKLLKIRWEYIMIILFLFPESYAIASYPNTAVFAAFSSLLGFYFITYYKSWNVYSVILLILAPLFRVDILMIYPVVFPLLLLKEPWTKSLLYSALYAITTVISIGFLFWMLSADPLSTFSSFNNFVENRIYSDKFIFVNLTFYSFFSFILIGIGTIKLIKEKQLKYLFVIFVPVLLTYYVQKDFGNATKHLLYILPFVVILASYAIYSLKYFTKKQYIYIIAPLAFIFVLYNLVSISLFPVSKPWIAKTYAVQHPYPVWELTSFSLPNQAECSFGIGIGQIIPTADELIPLTGSFFTPFYWKHVKNNEKSERAEVVQIINDKSVNEIVTITYGAVSFMTHYLVMDGYTIASITPRDKNRKSDTRIFEKDGRVITVYYSEKVKDINNILEAFQKNSSDKFYYFAGNDWDMYYINEGMTPASTLTNRLSIIDRSGI